MIRRVAASLWFAVVLMLACVASEQKVDAPPTVRVETTGTETGDPNASVQSNIRPLTTEEWREQWRASSDESAIGTATMSTGTASDTAQPLRPAERRTAHFPKPATPTGYPGPLPRPPVAPVVAYPGPVPTRALVAPSAALQAPRMRSGIGYTINVSPTTARMNLSIMMNARIPPQSWAKANVRQAVGVTAGGTFPVPLWRLRRSTEGMVATYITDIPVPASLDPSFQFVIPAGSFRGGDVAVIEDPPLDAILVETSGNAVIYPFISAIYPSGDPATIHGARMKFEGAR